ncbi:hypothetical protein ABKV64_23195, partial (plasmid) [Enterobacter roggenkampii]
KNSLNRLIRCVCGKKIGPDPRNFNQRVSLGRNDLLIRTFPNNPFQHCFENVEPYELLEDLESAINNHEKIIINIDLDYFFTDNDEKYFRFIDTKFIQNLFKILNEGMKTKKITCMTICLSPECCGDQNGNWSNSESVLQIAKTELGLNFIL